jgi:[protein-PII] uridylyltransferase
VATFHVNEIPEGPILDPDKWDNFCADIGKMVKGKLNVDELVAARRRAAKAYSPSPGPQFPLKVEIDNVISDRATVVEVYAHDRTGLLYDITSHLAELKLNIVLTKITTEVDQVADIFYVVDENSQKIADFDRLDEIKDSLRQHLVEMEESPSNEGKSLVF